MQTVEAREAVDKMQLLEDELRLLRSYAAERDAAVLAKDSEFANFESAQRTRLEDAGQHTSAYVSTRQHTSAYVSMRQHTSVYVRC
jgi:hypothetical protein